MLDTPDPAGAAPAPALQRTLGVGSLVSIGLGIVISQGAMVTMLQTAGVGGMAFYAALAVALLVSLCYVDTFAELALMLPQAAGLGRYTEVALGPFAAVVANFAGYIVVTFFAVAAELWLVDSVVQALLPGACPPLWVAFGVLLGATLLNIVGVDLFARLQNLLTVLKIGSMVGLGVLAMQAAPALAVPAGPPRPFDMALVLPLVAAVIWGLLGAEYICPMIEETQRPARTVPKAMWATLGVATVLYLVFVHGAQLRVPADRLAGAALPHLLLAESVAGRWGLLLVGIAALSASIGLVSSVLAAVPRLLYGMACEGQAFPVFRRLHPRFRTPWVAIVFIAAAIAGSLLTLRGDDQAFTVLILSAATSWLLAYVVAHLDVIVLRRRHPQLARPYRSRWLPWPQLCGIAAMLYCVLHVSPDPALTRSIYLHAGAVLALVAVVAAAWVKWHLRRPLFKPLDF
jgi:amino acid transporter